MAGEAHAVDDAYLRSAIVSHLKETWEATEARVRCNVTVRHAVQYLLVRVYPAGARLGGATSRAGISSMGILGH